MKRKKAVILLVEDSQADQVIVQRALEDGRVECELLIVENGLEALKLLEAKPPYNDRDRYPEPDLVLMDMNMPVMDGRDTLQRIRANEQIRHVPVVMLTTSSRDKDILDSYKLGVNAFLTKPVNEMDFVQTIIQLEQFWFELVTLPSPSRAAL